MDLSARTGVLVVNLGTPDSPAPSDVYRYLKQFLLDPRVIDYPWLSRQLLVRGIIVPFRHRKSAALYRQLWTEQGSPLKVYGESLVQQLRILLGEAYEVQLAMRYQSPSIGAAIKTLMDAQVERIVVLPLFPQYASATTGSVHDEVMRVLRQQAVIPEIHCITDYYAEPGMISVFADHAAPMLATAYDHILFSFHGLPQRQLTKADRSGHCLSGPDCCKAIGPHNRHCYSAQCYATARALAARIGLSEDRYTVCFQSRLGRDVWTQPYTSQVLHDRYAQGDRRILVFCPAFVADCLETTIEIAVEYREEFLAMGGEALDLVPGLNDDPDWAQVVADLIRRHTPQHTAH